MEYKPEFEVTLFPPLNGPEQFNNCTNIYKIEGGIEFDTLSGEHYVTTLPYKIRPEIEKNATV